MFDPSEPTEEELLAARDVPLEELRAKAQKRRLVASLSVV